MVQGSRVFGGGGGLLLVLKVRCTKGCANVASAARSESSAVISPTPQLDARWSLAWVLHGPEGCAVVLWEGGGTQWLQELHQVYAGWRVECQWDKRVGTDSGGLLGQGQDLGLLRPLKVRKHLPGKVQRPSLEVADDLAFVVGLASLSTNAIYYSIMMQATALDSFGQVWHCAVTCCCEQDIHHANPHMKCWHQPALHAFYLLHLVLEPALHTFFIACSLS